MKITAIRLPRMRLPLGPPFHAAWDPAPRRHLDATLIRVQTDEGVTGYGCGLLANLYVAAGVGGGPYLEFPYDPSGWTPARREFFLAAPLLADSAGCLTVPGRPGLGAQIDESAVARWAR